VLGFNHHADDLYVSLAGGETAEIFLSSGKPSNPCLLSSTSFLKECRIKSNSWQTKARIYVKGQIILQGFKPEIEAIVMVGKSKSRVLSDKSGLLKVELPAGTGEWLEVKVGF